MTDMSGLRDWRFSIDMQGIAWAVFDREGESQNSLGRRALEELAAIVERAEAAARDKSIRGLVFISGKEKGFIVGADVREFDQAQTEQQVAEAVSLVNGYLDRIERLPVPVVCCIHGFCLGGGLELALACHWRIATRDDATRIGFPEVQARPLPGLQRHGALDPAGRRALRHAADADRLDDPRRRRPRHGADRRAGAEPVEPHAGWRARRSRESASPRRRPCGRTCCGISPARGLLAKKFRAETAKKVREEHYPAPFRLIELFETHAGNLDGMKVAETRAFAPLMVGETSKNLRRVFKLSEMMKAQAPKTLAFKPLRVHVIGAGVMGADIAGWCVACGMEVSLQDVNAEQIAKGIAAQKKTINRKFKTKAQRAAAMARLIADPKGQSIGRADVVIEAIVEKLEVKQNLFKSIEGKLKPGAMLATNTSSIMIEKIAEPLADPGRLIGIHFFNPVAQMPLVEVIKGASSRDEEVGKGCAFVAAIDKFPLVVKSSPGFLVNRVLGPYMMAALQRVERGEPKEKIDEAARTFGMPMGPVELADTVGLDVCASVGKILNPDQGPTKLDQMVAAGKLGKKSGEGFYVWKDGKAEKAEPQAPYDRFELERLGRELVEPLIQEAGRVRDEKIVESADLVDAGVIFGTGFAPFRGGPLHFAATEQKSNVEVLRRTAAE